MNPASSQDNLEALRGGRNSDKDGSDFHFAGPNHMEQILTEDQDLPVHALPMNSEIRLYENGSFRGLICYEMKYERATLITLEPTEWHTLADRDFMGMLESTFAEPVVTWYSGFEDGCIGSIYCIAEGYSLVAFRRGGGGYEAEFLADPHKDELRDAVDEALKNEAGMEFLEDGASSEWSPNSDQEQSGPEGNSRDAA